MDFQVIATELKTALTKLVDLNFIPDPRLRWFKDGAVLPHDIQVRMLCVCIHKDFLVTLRDVDCDVWQRL
jgi:hypothetical protein